MAQAAGISKGDAAGSNRHDGKNIMFAFLSPCTVDPKRTKSCRVFTAHAIADKAAAPKEPKKPGKGKTDQDDAQLEEPKDDAFEEDDGDTSNVSE
jgi:hypothetical protein